MHNIDINNITLTLPDVETITSGAQIKIGGKIVSNLKIEEPGTPIGFKLKPDEKYVVKTTKCKCCGRKKTQTTINEHAKESDPNFIFTRNIGECKDDLCNKRVPMTKLDLYALFLENDLGDVLATKLTQQILGENNNEQ